MQWFRWYHGTCSDPKMGSIARKAGTTRERVIAVWAMVLESASEGEDRGLVRIDAEGAADVLNCETADVQAILDAMDERGMLAGGRVAKWEERQRKHDDSAERVRLHRSRKRGNRDVTVTTKKVTPVTDVEIDRDADTETSPSSHLSTRALSRDDEEQVSFVIRLANRGMSENPLIDPQRFRPILPQHGDSREVVAQWRASGIDWPTMEAVVYDRASKYKPSDRYKQIDRLTYFNAAVLEAHERRAAMDVRLPEIPTEEQATKGIAGLTGGPEVQEWAERLDHELREALAANPVLKSEVDQVRANLRRLNEQEREFKNLRTADQEAFLWIRILNWYGEKSGNPRPSRRLSAA